MLLCFPGSIKQTRLSRHEAAILNELPVQAPGRTSSEIHNAIVAGGLSKVSRELAHRGVLPARLVQLAAKGLILSCGSRKSGSTSVNAYVRTAGGTKALERELERTRVESFQEGLRRDQFWIEVYRLLGILEEDGDLPPETIRLLDALVDSDDEPPPQDMTPLEYIEGLMGEVANEHE